MLNISRIATIGALLLAPSHQAALVVGTRAKIAAYEVAAILAHFTIVFVVVLHHGARHIG